MNGGRITATLSTALIAAVLSVECTQAKQNTTTKAPDNSAVNKRGQDQSVPTADQAKNDVSDRQIMAHIRRDVINDKNLSTYAHNVKIIAVHGKVTVHLGNTVSQRNQQLPGKDRSNVTSTLRMLRQRPPERVCV
jgi:hyperosmotically inducible protein